MTIKLPKKTLEFLNSEVKEGSRNQELFDAACQLRDAGKSKRETADILGGKAHLVDGLTEAEALRTIESAFGRHAREPLGSTKPQTRYFHKRETPRREYDLSHPAKDWPDRISN